MMIHSTSTTLTPMTIQVTAVEDMMRLLAGLRRPQSMGSRNAWEAGDWAAAAGRVATARPLARASTAIGLAGSTVVSRAGGLRQSNAAVAVSDMEHIACRACCGTDDRVDRCRLEAAAHQVQPVLSNVLDS